MGLNFEVLEVRKQRTELKGHMRKMGSFVYLSCLHPDLWPLISLNWLIFSSKMVQLLMAAKESDIKYLI